MSEEDGAVDNVSEPLEKAAALLGDGLVLLGLSSQQYRKLRELKEVVADIKPDGEGLQHDRCGLVLVDVRVLLLLLVHLPVLCCAVTACHVMGTAVGANQGGPDARQVCLLTQAGPAGARSAHCLLDATR